MFVKRKISKPKSINIYFIKNRNNFYNLIEFEPSIKIYLTTVGDIFLNIPHCLLQCHWMENSFSTCGIFKLGDDRKLSTRIVSFRQFSRRIVLRYIFQMSWFLDRPLRNKRERERESRFRFLFAQVDILSEIQCTVNYICNL